MTEFSAVWAYTPSKQAELSLDEVLAMMEAAGEGLHHTHNGLILRTIYAAGLRVNELTKLLVADIEVDGKEAKDRYTLIILSSNVPLPGLTHRPFYVSGETHSTPR